MAYIRSHTSTHTPRVRGEGGEHAYLLAVFFANFLLVRNFLLGHVRINEFLFVNTRDGIARVPQALLVVHCNVGLGLGLDGIATVPQALLVVQGKVIDMHHSEQGHGTGADACGQAAAQRGSKEARQALPSPSWCVIQRLPRRFMLWHMHDTPWLAQCDGAWVRASTTSHTRGKKLCA